MAESSFSAVGSLYLGQPPRPVHLMAPITEPLNSTEALHARINGRKGFFRGYTVIEVNLRIWFSHLSCTEFSYGP